ncbi:hypothetical protein [Bacillus sp. B15-48]|uniref:hypothetical protein n=1 Tax=Bacillus sp. B15-48 TaxID=1548601 RepID=UPI0019400048|nr:hypothetical protein [Bacillus sp. B15-48]MBM4761080.1 hypothetical protein [Bacillus sp. B15-48]
MVHFLFLVIGLFSLVFVVRKIASLEKIECKTLVKEVKQNVRSLLWGIILVFLILVIPYEVWSLTGSSNDWDGVYITGATAIGTIIFCFSYYYRLKSKYN